jgi:hypothetical protein
MASPAFGGEGPAYIYVFALVSLAALAFLVVVALLIVGLVWVRGLSRRVEALENSALRTTPTPTPGDARIQRSE